MTTGWNTGEAKAIEKTEGNINLKGYKWTICVPGTSKYIPQHDNSERDKKLIDIYNKIEKLYNVDIEIEQRPSVEHYITSVLVGYCYSDVISINSYEIVPLALNKCIYSVEDPVLLAAGLNPEDNTRWYKDISKLVKWNGKQWTVQMNSAYEIPEFGSFILYNKDIINKLQIGSLADIVKSGQWTNEKYLEISRQAEKKARDLIGTVIIDDVSPVLANSGQIVKEKDGVWQNRLADTQTKNAISILSELKESQYRRFTGTASEAVEKFLEGKVAFLWTDSNTLLEHPGISDIAGGFGILPIPNKAGKDFASPIGSYCGYGFMTTNGNLNKSVIVFNKLAEEISEDWYSYYKEKTGLDNESIEILDLILPNKVFNYARYDKEFGDIFEEYISDPILNGEEDVEEMVQNASTAIDKVISPQGSEESSGGYWESEQ